MASPFIGEIKIVAFTFAPRNWAMCNGQLLPINQNQALFSILGTTYGGNGTTNFALPDFRGRAPLHVGGNFTLGETGGQQTETLSMNEMPIHNHVVNGNNTAGNNASPASASWAKESANATFIYSNGASGTHMAAQAIGTAGGNQAHNNLQPYLVLIFVIALTGVFPSRN